MKLPSRARAATAALLVGALGMAGAAYSPAEAIAPAAAAAAQRSAALPLVSIAVSKTGVVKLVDAPAHLRPGPVAFAVTSKNPDASVGFVRFHRGYEIQDFGSDMGKVFGKNDMKALKHVIANVTFLGGSGAAEGATTTGVVMLARAGTYTLYNASADNGGVGRRGPATLKVSGDPRSAEMPAADGTIKAVNGIQWGGDTTMPAQGTLKFRNAAADSPHFLEVMHVQDGTTKQDIMDYLNSGSQEEPAFALPEGIFAEVLSSKRSMTLDYDLPAGTYAILCFFPDVNMDGMPHAMMGMVEIITLQ